MRFVTRACVAFVVLWLTIPCGRAAAAAKTFHLPWPQRVPGQGAVRFSVTVPAGMKASLHDSTLAEADAVRVTDVTVETTPSQNEFAAAVTIRATRPGGRLVWECAMSPRCTLTVVDESDPAPPAHDAAASWCGPRRRLAKVITAPTDAEKLSLARDLAASMLAALRGACRGERCIAPIEELVRELGSPISLGTDYGIGAEHLGYDASFAGRRLGIQCMDNRCETRVALVANDAFVVRYVSDDEGGKGCEAGAPHPSLETLGEQNTVAHLGEVPGGVLTLRGEPPLTVQRELATPWPAELSCTPESVSFSVDESDAKLLWRSSDGLDVGITAKRDDHMGHGSLHVELPSAPQRLQTLSIMSGRPTAINIELECTPHESISWSCDVTKPTCELRRIIRQSRRKLPPSRAPFSQRYCVSPWDKVPNQLVALTHASAAELAKQERALHQLAAALLDEGLSELEQLCPAHDCSDEAEAALPLTRDAVASAGKATIAALTAGPAFELKRGDRSIATVRCHDGYSCAVYVPLPDGTRYGYGAGLNAVGHAHCTADSGFRDANGNDLGNHDEERGGVTGRYIRLWKR